MSTAMVETAEEVIARWRTSSDGDNPAGPLYAAGAFAEADIAAPDMTDTIQVCSTYCSAVGTACTASIGHLCC